jgi:hypothetical protein
VLATKKKEKKRIKYTGYASVSLTITPEKVKKWYYNQVTIDRVLLPLLLPFFLLSKHTNTIKVGKINKQYIMKSKNKYIYI